MEAFTFSVLALFFLGTAWLFASKVSKDAPPLNSTFLFQLIGIPFFVLLLPWAPHDFAIQSLGPIAFVGVFEALVMILLFYALKIGDLGVVIPITDGYAVITVLLGAIFLSEPITAAKILGLVLIICGITLISTQINKNQLRTLLSLKQGVVPALLTAIGTGVFFFLVGLLARDTSWFIAALGIRIVITLTTFIMLVVSKVRLRELFSNISWKWLILGAALDVIGFSFYNIALAKTEVSYATLMISAQSLVTVSLGYFFMKEKVVSRQWIGIVIALAGLLALQLK